MLSLVNGMYRVPVLVKRVVFYAVFALIIPEVCFAGEVMPWDGPLDTLMKSLTGPAAMTISTIVIGLTGFALAFGDTSGITKKLIMIVCGIAIVINANSILTTYVFKWSAGLGF